MLRKIIQTGVMLKIFWLLKDKLGRISLFLLAIAVIFYFHREFLQYVEISGNKKWLAESYFIKNLFLFLLLLGALFAFVSQPIDRIRSRLLVSGHSPQDSGEAGDHFYRLRHKRKLVGARDRLLRGQKQKHTK